MASKKQQKVKKRKRSRVTTMFILLGAIAVLTVATLLMRGAYHKALDAQKAPSAPVTTETEQKKSDSFFSVKEITVSGNTRYLPEALVQQSGLYVGQSVWSVDKTVAEEKVLAAFPYIEEVKISNTSYNKLEIAVTETAELGVMYAGGQWVTVGANGKALNVAPVESDRPLRVLYFKGAKVNSDKLGEQAMDARSFAIVQELLDAFSKYGLTGVSEIDLSNKSDIRLRWNSRMTVKLGNDSNLTHEIGVVMSALPGIESQYGVNAAGQLDVSAFSEKGGTPRAVFTPQDLLPAPGGSTSTPVGEEDVTGTETGTEGTSSATSAVQ